MMPFSLRRFMFSRLIAAIADQFMLFSVPLVILKYTGSIKYSALAFAIEWAPRLLFLPIAGQVADRINLNRLYPISDGLRVFIVFAAAIAVWKSPSKAFFILSVMMACLSLLQSLVFIGMEATLPRQLPVDQIPKAQSMLQSCDQLSQVIGPAAAGILVGFADLRLAIACGSGLFLISFFNSLGLPQIVTPQPEPMSLKRIIIDSYTRGFAAIRSNPILLQLVALTWVVNILYAGIIIIGPAMVTQSFMRPAKDFGYLQTIAALSSLCAMNLAPGFVRRLGLARLGAVSLISFCLGGFLAALSSSLAIYGIGAIAILTADGVFNIYIRSLRAQIIPKAHFGKVTGLIILLNNSSLPASGVIVSVLSKHFSHHQTLLLMSCLTAVLSVGILSLGKIKFRYASAMPSI